MGLLVASGEVGLGLLLVLGFMTIPATLGLLAILICATLCTAVQKVQEQKPVDDIDCVSCYLWRVEGVYIVIAFALLCMGPGTWSVDAWLF